MNEAQKAQIRTSARSLLRQAVKLNIQSRGQNNRFADERDEIVADLAAAGCPANYSDYTHPSEV